MSLLTMPAPTPQILSPVPREQGACREPRRSAQTVPAVVRRRGDARQGRALEALGHAVEYLVDSRMFLLSETGGQSDAEAAQILMRMSRAVFAECPEVVTLRRRMRMWVVERLANPLEARGTRFGG